MYRQSPSVSYTRSWRSRKKPLSSRSQALAEAWFFTFWISSAGIGSSISRAISRSIAAASSAGVVSPFASAEIWSRPAHFRLSWNAPAELAISSPSTMLR